MKYPSVTGPAFSLTDPTLIGQNTSFLEGAMATGLSNGQFVVVFRTVSKDKNGNTTDFGPLMGQLLNADGSRVGDQFQVLADDADAHPIPGLRVDPPLQVEALPDGGFVVQWQKSVYGVPHLQRFDSSGQKVGDEWIGEDWVTETEDNIYYKSQMMAVLPSGEIIMTFWEKNDTDHTQALRILQFSADFSTVEAREQEFPDGAQFGQSLDIDVLSDGRILMLF